MATLQVYNASIKFGKKEILKNVSFKLKTGETVGLYGRNGSGKSTLLKMIFGTLKGAVEIYIDGKKLSAKNNIPKKVIAYLPQHPFLPTNLKVRDVIPIYFTGEKEQDTIFYDAVIASFTERKVGELSMGQLKYFEVVLLGNLPHPFLLLDEPFSMLEPLHKTALQQFILQKKETKGILITDHYYHDVLEICNTNFVLTDGNIVSTNSVDDLRKFGYLK